MGTKQITEQNYKIQRLKDVMIEMDPFLMVYRGTTVAHITAELTDLTETGAGERGSYLSSV